MFNYKTQTFSRVNSKVVLLLCKLWNSFIIISILADSIKCISSYMKNTSRMLNYLYKKIDILIYIMKHTCICSARRVTFIWIKLNWEILLHFVRYFRKYAKLKYHQIDKTYYCVCTKVCKYDNTTSVQCFVSFKIYQFESQYDMSLNMLSNKLLKRWWAKHVDLNEENKSSSFLFTSTWNLKFMKISSTKHYVQ